MPTNLYGPNDNYDPHTSHVIPGMIAKFMKARQEGADKVVLWGTGTPRREFLHVDDLASAILHMLENYDGDIPLNIGTGEDIRIRELAELIAGVVGFEGDLEFDDTKPDGVPKKLLDVSRAKSTGWISSVVLKYGLSTFLEEHEVNTSVE
jgi:GDP-L-fucose synthase